MAKACSPWAPPKFIERTEANDKGGYVGAALLQAEQSGLFTKTREGHDAKWVKEQVEILDNILPMDFQQLTDYYVQNKWLSLNKAATKKALEAGDSNAVFKPTLNIEQLGTAAAVTKTYLESAAGGIRQLADNFLRKVDAGENATMEGLQFAQQMQGVSRFGGYVLGWDQGYGRAMRVQGLRNGGYDLAKGDRNLADIADKIGNMGEYTDKFDEIAKKLQDPASRVDGVNELINLAKRVQFLENPHDIARVTTMMHVAGGAWQEIFINGLLSGPATFAANATAMAWTVMRPMMQLGAAKTYALMGLPGARVAEEAAAEAGAALGAMQSALSDSMRIGWRAARTERSLYQAGAEGGVDFGISGDNLAAAMKSRGLDAPSDGLRELTDLVGKAVRLPSRALLGTDEMAKHLTIRGEVAARAVKLAAQQGIDVTDGAALRPFIESEMRQAFDLHKPELWDKYKLKSNYNLRNNIQLEADRATFQEENGWASNVQKVLGTMPYLRPFVPFVRTPLNILKQGFVESTGFGAILNTVGIAAETGLNPTAMKIRIAQKLLEDPGESFRISGQIAMTSLIAGTFYMSAMNGSIVGGGPGRWSSGGKLSDAQKAWEGMMREQGKVPYSINIGGTSIPFDRFPEPVAGILRMTADMGQYSAYVPQESQEEWLAGMAVIMVSGLYNSTFLKGLNDVIDIVGDPSSTFGAKGTKAVQNYVATQMPFGGFLSFVDRTEDPFKHAYGGATLLEAFEVHEDAFGTSIFAKLADRIPGFGGTPMLVDQISGLPVPSMPGHGPGGLNPLQMAIPFLPRGHKGADGAWTAIYEITGSYKERTPKQFKLTNAEQQDLNKRMATARIGGKTLQEAILAYRAQPEVEAYVRKKGAAFMNVRTQIERGLNAITLEYYLVGMDGLTTDNKSVRQRATLAEGMGLAAMSNDPQQANQYKSELDRLFEDARIRGTF